MFRKLTWGLLTASLIGSLAVAGLATDTAYAAEPGDQGSDQSQMGPGMMDDMGAMMGMMSQMMGKTGRDEESFGQGMMGDMTGMMETMSTMMGQMQGMMGNRSDSDAAPGTSDAPAPWGKAYPIEPSRVLESFLADLDQNLVPGAILDLGKQYYAEAIEKDTGIGAYGILINRTSGVVLPETGPNLDWNVKYGTEGTAVAAEGETIKAPEMTVTREKAVEYARRYLELEKSTFEIDESARSFYGYYNLTVLENGKPVGIISVNGYNGRVWDHSWLRSLATAAQPAVQLPDSAALKDEHHPDGSATLVPGGEAA